MKINYKLEIFFQKSYQNLYSFFPQKLGNKFHNVLSAVIVLVVRSTTGHLYRGRPGLLYNSRYTRNKRRSS